MGSNKDEKIHIAGNISHEKNIEKLIKKFEGKIAPEIIRETYEKIKKEYIDAKIQKYILVILERAVCDTLLKMLRDAKETHAPKNQS
jgi:predicted transcriptional regulator